MDKDVHAWRFLILFGIISVIYFSENRNFYLIQDKLLSNLPDSLLRSEGNSCSEQLLWASYKQSEKSLITTVYRKPTHRDLYLKWDSHHNLAAKYSVINNLTHRAKTVCFNLLLLNEEENYLRQALRRCKYPRGLLTGQYQIQQGQQKIQQHQEEYYQQHQQTSHRGAIHQGFKWKL